MDEKTPDPRINFRDLTKTSSPPPTTGIKWAAVSLTAVIFDEMKGEPGRYGRVVEEKFFSKFGEKGNVYAIYGVLIDTKVLFVEKGLMYHRVSSYGLVTVFK